MYSKRGNSQLQAEEQTSAIWGYKANKAQEQPP